ncbi:hypothetical protein ACOSQ4_002822 [Xanthoceras sorbifolium]
MEGNDHTPNLEVMEEGTPLAILDTVCDAGAVLCKDGANGYVDDRDALCDDGGAICGNDEAGHGEDGSDSSPPRNALASKVKDSLEKKKKKKGSSSKGKKNKKHSSPKGGKWR